MLALCVPSVSPPSPLLVVVVIVVVVVIFVVVVLVLVLQWVVLVLVLYCWHIKDMLMVVSVHYLCWIFLYTVLVGLLLTATTSTFSVSLGGMTRAGETVSRR